jgi:hypothetical protein
MPTSQFGKQEDSASAMWTWQFGKVALANRKSELSKIAKKGK